MVFASQIFLFWFLPVFLAAHHLLRRHARDLIFIAGSFAFYAWWRVDFCLLLLGMVCAGYGFGRLVERAESHRARTAAMVAGVALCLGVLGYFKYFNFGVENMNAILSTLGMAPLSVGKVILPIGISFFTFQALSYIVDVYRRDIEAERSFLRFAAYLSLFPQLIAGPIVRYREVREDFRRPNYSLELFAFGVTLFAFGFAKKVLIADNLAHVADPIFALGDPTMREAWLGTLAYSFQLFFDFSGYSDMAIGLGLMIGLRFPCNFRQPYLATSITDFWRRWHLTLSRFLRDYLYIPLGGNQKGARRTQINLILTMLLGGLWHGAGWTFVIWGGFHGGLLALERFNGKRALGYHAAPWTVRVLITFLLVCVGWVFFRAETLPGALTMLAAMGDLTSLTAGGLRIDTLPVLAFAVIGLAIATILALPDSMELAEDKRLPVRLGVMLVFDLAILELLYNDHSPFLYFQF